MLFECLDMTSATSLDMEDDEFKQFITQIGDKEGLKNCEFLDISKTLKGGYIGVVNPVRITGDDASGNKKEIHLVVKCAPMSKGLRETRPIHEAFVREVYMYNTVIPQLCHFQEEQYVTDAFASVAKYYNASTTEYKEFVLLENMKEAGYDLWNRQRPMGECHALQTFKELGKFHALSFALRDQQSEEFLKLTEPLDAGFLEKICDSGLGAVIKASAINALNVLDPQSDEQVYEVFKKFNSDVAAQFKSVLTCPKEYCVVLHGDAWCNNIMFKYDNKENSEKPTNVCFLDWQMSILGSPVLDLSYFLYSSCSAEVIDNYKLYLQEYYHSFAKQTRKLGSDPEKLYSFEKFEEHWKEYSRYGLIMAPILMHVLCSMQDTDTNFCDSLEAGKSLSEAFTSKNVKSDQYPLMVNHLIKHFVQNKFI